jgi:hypothetical protein
MSDALSGPVGDLPDAWVEAAAKADYEGHYHLSGRKWADTDETERENFRAPVRRALAAAVPLIRAHIADQLDEFAEKATTNHEHWAYRHAARVARGGTDADL